MSEIVKDFIKFVAEVFALLIIFSVVFSPEGIATSTFNYFVFAEPILLQNYIASAMTIGSQTSGEFYSNIKLTSGLPHNVKIFFKDDKPYVSVIPSQEVFSKTTYTETEPSLIITSCDLAELDIKLPKKTDQTLTIKKTFENNKCKLELSVGSGIIESGASQLQISSCDDGVMVVASGQCSVGNPPKFCDNGNLIDKCSSCGCSSGQSCNSMTDLCFTPSTQCPDGTAYNSCSDANRPSWCNSTGSLVPNQCGSTLHNCPCPSGQSCQSDGSCITPSTCDSQCKSQGYDSGTCRTSAPVGWLHTEGTKILNTNNEEVIWNGIDSKTLFGYWTYASGGRLEEFLHASDVQVMRNHGLNTIRVDISFNSAVYGQTPGTPTLLNYYPRFWQLLDELVLAGEQNGVWIKINFGTSDGTWANIGGFWGDGNGFPKWMYNGSWSYFNKIYTNDATGRSNAIRDFWNLDDPTAANVRIAFQTFWKDIVTRYKDSPNVVFSLFNEPQNQWGGPTLWDGASGRPTQTRGAEMYRDFMEQTIDAIRNIDGGKHLIVIDEAYFWDYATNLKVNRPNIIVENHAYNVIDQSFVNLGWRYNQPFMLGEFGGVEQGGLQDRAGTIANMQFCNYLGVSWLYLTYDITHGYPSVQTWTDIESNLHSNLKYANETGTTSSTCQPGETINPTATSESNYNSKGTVINLDNFYPGRNYQPNAWTILQDLGVNVIDVRGGGASGNIAHWEINLDASVWATNFNDFLNAADSHGIKLIFSQTGNMWHSLFGIECPEPYNGFAGTTVAQAKALIDKLAGNNILNHNFLADPRIIAWSPANEVDLANPVTRDWVLQILDYMKSKGATVFLSAPRNTEYNPGWVESISFQATEPIIRGHVDFLDYHDYGIYDITLAKNAGKDIYTTTYNLFKQDLQNDVLAARGSTPVDKIILGEFGIWHGYDNGAGMGDLPADFSEAERGAYYRAVYQVAAELGIKHIFNFLTFAELEADGSYQRRWEVIDVGGVYFTECTNVMKQYYRSSIGQDGCSSVQSCCCYTGLPVRHVDFETGDFSQVPPGDTHGDNGLNLPTIVTNKVHSGTYAAECRINDASTGHSSDVRMWGIHPKKAPLYYSFWIYVEDGYEVVGGADTWNAFAEWCAPNPIACGKHVDLSMMDNYGINNNIYMNFYQIHLDWGIPGADPQYPNAAIWSNVSMPTGKWVFFETYYKTDMTNGIIQVKMDGKTILEWEGRTEFDPGITTDISWTIMNYCGTQAPPHSFWFDDVWIDYVSHDD